MPTTSLKNMSVPIMGEQSGNMLQHPKLKYRFRVTFENFGAGGDEKNELTKQVVTASRPDLQHDKITIDVYNSRVFLVGKHTWQPLSITLRDDSAGRVHKIIGEQLQRQVNHYEQSSAIAGETYKFLTKFEVLDGGNGQDEYAVLEAWDLLGCYIESANYNEADYSQSDVMTIQLSISFDNALYSNDGREGGIGAPMKRGAGSNITGIQAGHIGVGNQ